MKIFSFFLLLIFGLYAQAQHNEKSLITTTGKSNIKVLPDYAVLGIRLEREINPVDWKKSGLLKIFDKQDIDIQLFDFENKNIDVSLINLDSNLFVKEVIIKFYDLKKMNQHLHSLVLKGYTEFSFFEYKISDLAKYESQLLTEAVKNAREKAQLISSTLDQSIGRAFTIRETPIKIFNWYNSSKIIDNKLSTFYNLTLLEPGYLNLVSEVEIGFELK